MSELKIRKSTIVVIVLLLFPVFNLINIPFVEYYDEIIGLAGFITVILFLIERKLTELDTRICICLIAITIIGLVSNILFGLANSNFGVLIDILHLWKTFSAYFLFKYALDHFGSRQRAINVLSILARLMIIFMVACSLMGQVIDIGVCSNTRRIGPFKIFYFFWRNGIQTGWLIFSCILILAFSRINKRSFLFYYVFSLVPMLLTGSMLVYSFVVLETVLLILWRGKKLKFTYILIIGCIIVLVAWQDIVSYFLDVGVRMQFYISAFSLSVQYFPLGTGFATFGSEMAARYYSDVYFSLGWANSWALGQGGAFLNDNFFASILGQFGLIGLILYLMGLYFMFKSITSNKQVNKIQRITLISVLLTIIVVMLGSPSAKSMMGIFTFALLGFFSGGSIRKEECGKSKLLINKKMLFRT